VTNFNWTNHTNTYINVVTNDFNVMVSNHIYNMSSFKAEDVKDSERLQQLLRDITNDPSLVDKLPEDELIKIENLISPYGTVAESSTNDVYTCLSFTNLRLEYTKKLIITAMLGYLYRRCDEYGRAFKDTVDYMDDMKAAEKKVISNQRKQVEVEKNILVSIRDRIELKIELDRLTAEEQTNRSFYEDNQARMTKVEIHAMRDVESLRAQTKDKLRLATAAIFKFETERDALQGFGKRFIIRQFLDEQFRFNSDKHVRSSYSEQAKGAAGTTYVSKFVPPDDTFHNFQYYLDSNYEELRAVTHNIYKVKPDLDVGIIPYGSFGTQEEADNFVERNKKSTIASILTLKNGSWNFLEAFKANRDRIEAYRGTIVEDILQQVKDDMKIGSELTRDRAIRRRTENIKNTRPDPKMVKDYMANRGKADVSDAACDTELTTEEQEKIYKAHIEQKETDENALLELDEETEEQAPHDTVRVNVFSMFGGGKELKKSHFFSHAKDPEGKV
jgi:hypothetical protein